MCTCHWPGESQAEQKSSSGALYPHLYGLPLLAPAPASQHKSLHLPSFPSKHCSAPALQVVGLVLCWVVLPRQSPQYVLVIDSGSTGTRMCAPALHD